VDIALFIAAAIAGYAAIIAYGLRRPGLSARRVICAVFVGGGLVATYFLWRRIVFARPLWLLGLLVIVPLYVLYRRSSISISRIRRRCALFTHFIVLALLVAALAGIKATTRSESLCVVFVLDVSRSVDQSDIDAAKAAIEKMVENMTEKDSAALIVFGGEASMEIGYSPKEKFKVGGITSVISRDFSDLSEAIRLAIASFRQDAQKRIVLISDGNQNSGSAVRAAVQAKSAGADLQCVWLKGAEKEDVLLKRLIVPEIAGKGDRFDIRFTVESTYDTKADITILVDDREIEAAGLKNQEIKKGENFFRRQMALPDEGLHTVKVRVADGIKAADNETDDIINNNQSAAFVRVPGRSSRVLYIEGARPPEQSEEDAVPGKWEPEKFLREALGKSKLDVDVRTPAGIPGDLAEYEQYDAVIISDTAAQSFEARNVMEKLRSYVRDMGGGLVMVGGENSFALGNYTGTPIEEALPVNCDVREQYHLASIAIAIVVDRSGSMAMGAGGGKNKLQLAGEGIVATLKNLKDRDRLGVLFVDTATLWKPEIRGLKMSRNEIIRNVRGAVPGGGGILVRTGLVEAYLALRKVNANVKHIILFADASDAEEQENSESLARQGLGSMPRITLSVIGLGTQQDSDAAFLGRLAKAGKGRFHLVNDARKLPSLFVKDALIATRSYIVEKDFRPRVTGVDPALKGIIDESLEIPVLRGYVGVTKKDTATVSLKSPLQNKSPILARWQYGLGKSAAFTSDCKNRWAVHWIDEESGFYHKFWGQLVRSIMRSPFPTLYSSQMIFDRQTGRIEVEALDEGRYVNYLDLKARVVLPDGKAIDVDLPQQGPGLYRGEFDAEQVGAYFTVIIDEKSGRPIGKIQRGIPYSPEYMTSGGNPHLLQ